MSFKRFLCGLTASAMLMLSGCGDIYGSDAEIDEETETLSEEDTDETESATEEESSTDAATTAEVTTTTVPETTTAVTEPETVEETTAAQPVQQTDVSDENNIIPGVALWDSKDDVLAEQGVWDYEYEDSTAPSVTYCYMINGSDVFGVDISGYKFFEFEQKHDRLICYGYHFGCMLDNGKEEFPYSQDELKAAYDKVSDRLVQWYGGAVGTSSFPGIKAEYKETLADNSQIWAVYGEDMWSYDGSATGINDVTVSVSVSDEDRINLNN